MAAMKSRLGILLIDDDDGVCSSLSRILRSDGYDVDIAQSANQALQRSNWHQYFAVLLDQRLPDSTADELLPKLISLAPHAAVLVVTGYADLDSSLQAIRAGAADYLLKPVDPDELRIRLRRLADLKHAQDEVRKRDAQVQFMIEHLPAGAAYVDDATGAMLVNQAIQRITGYSAAELPDRAAWFAKVFGPRGEEFRSTYEQDRSAAFPGPRNWEILARDGRRIDIEFRGYKYDEHEVWLVQDVTERLRIQNELRQERDFADRVLDTAQVIILILDVNANIVRFNRFMQELSGYQLEEVVGRDWFGTFLPEPERIGVRGLFERVVRGEVVQGHMNSILTRDGRVRQIAWWANTLRDADGCVTAVLSIGHDVTALNDIQDKLVQSERLAAIGQMIAGLAHESRNALQRARACLDMLSLDLGAGSPQLDLTRRVQTALDELQRLFEEVRGYAAPINLSLGRCDLADVWDTAWRHVIQAHTAHDVTLMEDLGDIDTQVVADRYRVEQVFRNVLENAVAVSPAGGKVTVACQDCELAGEPAICISIVDEGPGLNSEQAARLFEPFYTTKQKGTGLGLPISQRIIEAHNGTIRLGDGGPPRATIEIRLPRGSA